MIENKLCLILYDDSYFIKQKFHSKKLLSIWDSLSMFAKWSKISFWSRNKHVAINYWFYDKFCRFQLTSSHPFSIFFHNIHTSMSSLYFHIYSTLSVVTQRFGGLIYRRDECIKCANFEFWHIVWYFAISYFCTLQN